MSQRRSFFLRKLLSQNAKEMAETVEPLAIFNFDNIGINVAASGRYEAQVLEMLARDIFPRLSDHSMCFDIGANIGNHSVFFANHFKQVFAFEPNPRVFKLLQANAMLKSNIATNDIGVSDEAGECEVGFARFNVGTASLHSKDDTEFTTTFKLERLDDFVAKSQIEALDFIKIDVERHEFQALTGATETLKKFNPVIMLEVLNDEIEDGSAKTLDLLKSLGYEHLYLPSNILNTATKGKRRFAKLLNALNVLLFGKRLTYHFQLTPPGYKLTKRNHSAVILSVEPLKSL